MLLFIRVLSEAQVVENLGQPPSEDLVERLNAQQTAHLASQRVAWPVRLILIMNSGVLYLLKDRTQNLLTAGLKH